MSGGYFDNNDTHLIEIAEQLDAVPDDLLDPNVSRLVQEARQWLRVAYAYVRPLDLWLSGDISAGELAVRIDRELNNLTWDVMDKPFSIPALVARAFRNGRDQVALAAARKKLGRQRDLIAHQTLAIQRLKKEVATLRRSQWTRIMKEAADAEIV